ncbi:D-2-hydroxyacid dehydrogenase family protein [Nakamurella sp. GG22]
MMMPPTSPIAVAILDDYQGVATSVVDWGPVAARGRVVAFADHLDDPDALVERLEPFDVVVAMRERTPFPREVLARLPRLKLLVTTGMRNKSIELAAAGDLGITVSGTGLVAESTVELAWALIMAVVRDLPGEDRRTRAGDWQRTVPLQLAGSTLGILGLGRLGQRVAAIARLFGMTVIAWSENLTAEVAAEHGAELVGKADLFRRSDVVTLHTLLSRRTRGLVGAAELEMLGPDGYLVNTSRGPIVDEHALVAALRNGTIAGAALDVFDIEPLPDGHPLLSTPRTILSPHVGFVSRQAYEVAYGDAVQDILGWLDGTPVRVLAGPA